MREIKFRGKRIDNNEWVYGYFTKNHKTGKCYITTQSVTGGARPYEVIPETVGQYIGAKDKNSKKIFEGDIAEKNYYSYQQPECLALFLVVYDGIGFELAYRKGKTYYNPYAEIVEVIGNIYDNPELLEVV